MSLDWKNIQATLTPPIKDVSLFTSGLSSITAPCRKSALTKAFNLRRLYTLLNPTVSDVPL
jgi:hypothetical protein